MFKYNTVEGIEEYLKDLAGLNKLKAHRCEAGYVRKERLNEFIILGRWRADTCGNFMKIKNDGSRGVIPAEVARCPNVITYDEVWNILGKDISICSGMNSDIPPDYVKCSICEQPWTINNAHDCIQSSDTKVIDANPFIGAILSEIKTLPQYLDISPHNIHKDSIRPKNKDKGSDRVDEKYKIQEGDSLFATVFEYKHSECNKLNTIQESLKEINNLILRTNIHNYELIMMKNQYGSGDYNGPWYRLKFKSLLNYDTEIVLGWRKSVIHISWEKSGKNLLHLFEDENVTKQATLIHAHGYDKAAIYLNRLYENI